MCGCESLTKHIQIILSFDFYFCVDFVDGVEEVFFGDFGSVFSDGKVSCFGGDCFDFGSAKVVGCFDDAVDVDFGEAHVAGVDFEDFQACFFVGEVDVNQSIKSSGADDCRV